MNARAHPPTAMTASSQDLLLSLARYNLWATRRLLTTLAPVSDADYRRDLGLFFRSIHGTLNHLIVGEHLLWYRRFSEGLSPRVALDAEVEPDRSRVAFFFDIDNTLLDNDRVSADMRAFLQRELGPDRPHRYWELFEELRSETGYADYLGALQRYRLENLEDSHMLVLSRWFLEYPFANRLFPGSLDAIEHVRSHGPTVILSDGDVVFQPRKIHRAGIFEAVDGNILVYIHKELELADVERRYPAKRYVMVDDKPRLLDAVKRVWGERVTTVFPRQGHYALDPDVFGKYLVPDVTIQRIGELVDYDLKTLLAAARPAPAARSAKATKAGRRG